MAGILASAKYMIILSTKLLEKYQINKISNHHNGISIEKEIVENFQLQEN